MAFKVNSAVVFKWRVEINGLDSFECQSVTLPSPETEAIDQGGGGYIAKTPGIVNVGDLVLVKLKPVDKADSFAWDWMKRARSSANGNGEPAQFSEQDITVKLLANDGSTTLYSYSMTGVWVKKIEYNELSKTTSENVLETITCSVDTMNEESVPNV